VTRFEECVASVKFHLYSLFVLLWGVASLWPGPFQAPTQYRRARGWTGRKDHFSGLQYDQSGNRIQSTSFGNE